MRSVKRRCRGWHELEGSSSPRTVTPFTSANACICQWRRNAPELSPGQCNAFADLTILLAMQYGAESVACHANPRKARCSSRRCEFGKGRQRSGADWVIETIAIRTSAIGTIVIETMHGTRKPRSFVLVRLPSGLAVPEKPCSLSGTCFRVGRFRQQDS